MHFGLLLERKTGKELIELTRLGLLKKFLAYNFALSDTENRISRPLNRGIADLPLLKTLLAICQKFRKERFI